MEEEKKYFDFVIKYVNEKLNQEFESFDELQYKYRKNPDFYGIAYNLACRTLKILTNAVKKPYFGRIDFKSSDYNTIEKIYIGKYGISDEAKTMVVDWRAPISTLYYNSELGNTSYICPDGEIKGNLLLKRQFEIEDGNLINYYDVDLVSNDLLLQKYLNENNDSRLKNIVSTIQSEQNEAIRKPINQNTIVQGVAGSGKTTIALHRLAYLIYNYKNKIKNNQYLVIGPNSVFLKYIKNVLPDLDVDGVNQETYETFAKNVIDDVDFNIKSSSGSLVSYLNGKANNDIPKFKNSLKYKSILDSFIDDYINDISNQNFEVNGYEILSKEQIRDIFMMAINDTTTFNKAIDRFVLLASYHIEKNHDSILSLINSQFKEKSVQGKLNSNYDKCLLEYRNVRSELDKYFKSSLRKFIVKYRISPIRMYKKFMNKINIYEKNYEYLDELKSITLKNIKNLEFDFEDLAALMHIRCRLGISDIEKKYRHVIVDEAQDLGEFNFYTLKECLPNSTFSIYGDIAQSIYDYRSIDSWNDVLKIFNNCELLEFRKSYRTTDEIMNIANSVSESIGLKSSELSIRHGNNVCFEKVDQKNIPKYIKDKVTEYIRKGYKTIAIISKYPTQSSYINDDLSYEGLIIPNIDEKSDITKEGNEIVTISNYISKGLEFDAVILNGVDEKIYDSNSSLDMKMLYVALTRALHELDVIYSEQPPKPLKKFINKENDFKRNKNKSLILEPKRN